MLVTVIHVPSAAPPATPPYMNLPGRDVPEYVDMTEYDEMPEESPRPQYVNVPLDPSASPGRRRFLLFCFRFLPPLLTTLPDLTPPPRSAASA